MLGWIKSLDQVLRGRATRPEDLKDGELSIPIGGLIVVLVLLAMTYGICMGTFALFKEFNPEVSSPQDRWLQVIASAVKVPALFFLTLVITFPSLYVFNALVGSRLSFTSMLKLLIAALAVNLAVLASLGPIVAFFSVSTTSYRFMQLFNVLMFSVAGGLGLTFLFQTLKRLMGTDRQRVFSPPEPEPQVAVSADSAKEPEVSQPETVVAEVAKPTAAPSDSQSAGLPGALDHVVGQASTDQVRWIFRLWMLVFGLVGAQMGWVLRPFIGDPDQPFTWFRERQSNFFMAIVEIIGELLKQ